MKNQRTNKAAMLLAIAGLATISLTSCNSEQETKLKNQEVSIAQMKSELVSKENEFNEVLNLMNQVEGQVAAIVKKHELIADTESGKKSSKDKLIKELDMIGTLVDESNKTIAELNGKLRNSNLKTSGFQKRINQLTADLEERSALIIDLKDQIEMKNEQFQVIAGLYDSVQIQSANQVRVISDKEQEIELLNGLNDNLNTVRYAVGSYKDLKERGLVTKERGFLGLGRSIDLNESANDDEYIKIDIREFNKLPIEASQVQLISEHPADSYVIIQDENEENIKYLEITVPEKFWKVSKYLVISTKS
ncbi:MAG: hypothetical protein COW03_12475 [Cytophagales bacterium CG12_big_fil_rev_8_21_14_0_65_40_12]|nr:MAG: hypothetical protein COW03_12475 [Cytophagales bacterium CG12_big_fil_rev_8_21_14_0_65_40_12]PIW04908.1 MAG: hypothetical protein COW40_07560 [Cytophagales bacterium CG17_big_fil_post_rev_8_21_14_2_50_40_13]